MGREKMPGCFDISPTRTSTMDAVHINQIGTQLEDLSERTQELRGYL